MSLTFISNINEHSSQKEIDNQCSLLWNTKKDTAIKLFFFVRDKTQGKNEKKPFIKIMKWLWKNHQDTFYKNFSLIVGIPNSHTLKLVESSKMLKSSYKKHQEILDYFIQKDHQQTFKENWENTTKMQLLETWSIPQYGDWEDIILISEECQDKKLFYTTANIIIDQLRKNMCPEILETLKKFPKYEEFIKKSTSLTQNTKSPQERKLKKHINFNERYAFITV